MKKRMIALLSIGLLGILLGIILAVIDVSTEIRPYFGLSAVLLVAASSAWIAWVVANKGGTAIRDEMVLRVESISGKCSFDATLLFIMALGISNYFYPLPLSVSWLLVTLLLFMSLTFTLVRHFLMKRGKAE